MGDVLQDVDGFYKFWPEHHGGYWDAGVMQELVNLLNDKNKEWEKQLQEYFASENSGNS